MYQRRNNFSYLFTIAAALLFVFGGYYVWRGMIGFLDNRGNITADVTAAALRQTQSVAIPTLGSVMSIDNIIASPTPKRPCFDFRVSVPRANIRECPRNTCSILGSPEQDTRICVYGGAEGFRGWYEINTAPNSLEPRIGYMHESVITPLNPTSTPTRTFTPLPTITSVPTERYTRTPALANPTITPTISQ
jgi:hypothetical protein